MNVDRKTAGIMAVKTAIMEWEKGVRDHPSCPKFHRITDYITASLNSYHQYEHQKRMWCGDFVAACYDGIMAPSIQHRLLQSTYRLWVLANYSVDWNEKKQRGVWKTNMAIVPDEDRPIHLKSWHQKHENVRMLQQPNLLDGALDWDVEAGDIATVGVAKDRPWGKHIVLCEGVEGNKLLTIEGNGYGSPPSGHGRRWEGVVRNKRSLSDVQMIIRLSDLDFIQEQEMVE